MFVYNCTSESNVTWLKNFVESSDPINNKISVPTIDVWDLNKNVNDRPRKSFKIIIDAKHDDIVFSDDFWPAHVKMRRWKRDPHRPKRVNDAAVIIPDVDDHVPDGDALGEAGVVCAELASGMAEVITNEKDNNDATNGTG